METGRCSLIDGTGHGRAAARKTERKKEEKRGKRAEEEESEGEESKRTTCGERRRRRRAAALLDHHRLIYNAGDSRIHDQNPAFRGIDGSPGAQRAPTTLVFSNEPAPFSSSRCLRAA